MHLLTEVSVLFAAVVLIAALIAKIRSDDKDKDD